MSSTPDPGFGFVVLLGDNFYEDGVASVDDPQWQTKFEDPYANIDLPFYAVLGNHDHMPPLMRRLDCLADREPNFVWHEYLVRLGGAAMQFGDGDMGELVAQHFADQIERRLQHEGRDADFAARLAPAAPGDHSANVGAFGPDNDVESGDAPTIV